MHPDQVDIDERSVRQALDHQFPRFCRLPLRRLASSGTVNAVFRLGEHLVVRVPMVGWGAADAVRDREILPCLTGRIPVQVPALVEVGEEAPDLGIPWKWSVLSWIAGEPAHGASLGDPNGFADAFADLLAALASIPVADAPASLAHGQVRDDDARTRLMITETRGLVDDRKLLRAWEVALDAPDSVGPGTGWIHADPTPGNLILAGDRLTAVIDWSAAGVGDVAHDLIAAWWVLASGPRRRLQLRLDLDEGTWARGRARALKKAIWALPYYAQSNPGLADDARFALDQIVEESPRRVRRLPEPGQALGGSRNDIEGAGG